jgi:hypothetical protein
MPTIRDHQGIVLERFNGLYQRGDLDTTPLDHFADCNNIKLIGDYSFRTRDGIGITQNVLVPLRNVKRIYNYPTQTANTLIVLTYNYDTGYGSIHHVVDKNTVYGPLLSIKGMTDFAFVPYAGRAYISPFSDYVNGDLVFQKGLANEFLYVYDGLGNRARKVAGTGLSGSMTVANGAAGHTDAGQHVFGIVSQTISGYNAPPTILTGFVSSAGSSVSFGSIPTSGDPSVVKRLLVATKVINTSVTPWNGNLTGSQFFFVPNAVINNNSDTFLNNISFYDADLLSDASSLLDNYTSIPAGASLSLYHNRLCLAATATDISLILVSQPGEPEAINQISGLIVFPLDGNPITNAQEMRDVFYVFKRAKTVAYADNGGDPSSWPLIPIDSALGTSVHGIATVLDSGSSSIDFLIVATYQGISQFNGRYVTPELSFKIINLWAQLDRNKFGSIQIVNAVVQKELYVILPTRNMLVGNYANGMDWKNIRWTPWSFRMGVNTVAIHNIDEIILGADIL